MYERVGPDGQYKVRHSRLSVLADYGSAPGTSASNAAKNRVMVVKPGATASAQQPGSRTPVHVVVLAKDDRDRYALCVLRVNPTAALSDEDSAAAVTLLQVTACPSQGLPSFLCVGPCSGRLFMGWRDDATGSSSIVTLSPDTETHLLAAARTAWTGPLTAAATHAIATRIRRDDTSRQYDDVLVVLSREGSVTALAGADKLQPVSSVDVRAREKVCRLP